MYVINHTGVSEEFNPRVHAGVTLAVIEKMYPFVDIKLDASRLQARVARIDFDHLIRALEEAKRGFR
jgi:hypothetical protein